jgi:hypothetical protein
MVEKAASNFLCIYSTQLLTGNLFLQQPLKMMHALNESIEGIAVNTSQTNPYMNNFFRVTATLNEQTQTLWFWLLIGIRVGHRISLLHHFELPDFGGVIYIFTEPAGIPEQPAALREAFTQYLRDELSEVIEFLRLYYRSIPKVLTIQLHYPATPTPVATLLGEELYGEIQPYIKHSPCAITEPDKIQTIIANYVSEMPNI